MTVGLAALVLMVSGGLLLWALARNIELARLRVRAGTTKLVRGRLPPELLSDVRDVVGRARIARAAIRLVVQDGRLRVVAQGLDDATAQQVRNLVGPYTVAQVRAGRARQ